ncbi:MAG: RnfABCDGE type electron transport complex subunit A [Candidatus Izemoplasmatales bacterium]|jgi:electron transport complex protein RnfA
MSELIQLAFIAFIVENIVLTQFLGICPFIGVSRKRSSALGMGMAVVFVILISSILTWVIYHYVLALFSITYMRTIVFILVIASLVQMVELFLKKISPALYKALGIYLPLITTNCAVLGVAIINIDKSHTFSETVVYSLFISLGFLFVMYIFSMIREKLDFSPVPKAFKGVPIALVVAAILALVFSRLGGIV